MKLASETYAVVADIGGTNTRVALARGIEVQTDTVTRYRNKDYLGLEPVLIDFLSKQDGIVCDGACVALAGPVQGGRGSLTNLDWTIDEETLARATNAKNVSLLNDLQAQGHAIGHLGVNSVRTLLEGSESVGHATKLVIGIGTGFNMAPVFETPTGRFIPPAEAGHTTLPARSDDALRFAASLEKKHGFAATEDMLSGRGLERLYTWVSSESGEEIDKQAADIMRDFEQATDPQALKTARIFVAMTGSVAGDLALTSLPFGGIYFAGGVARAFAPHFDDLGFAAAFRDKGRFAKFMQRFSVHVIEDDYAALTGCAIFLQS